MREIAIRLLYFKVHIKQQHVRTPAGGVVMEIDGNDPWEKTRVRLALRLSDLEKRLMTTP